MNKVYHIFPEVRQHAKLAKTPSPYLFDYYNVFCYTPNPVTMIKNALARDVNCLIKALNESLKLPQLVIYIPDADILKFVLDTTASTRKMVIHAAINWIITQMDRALSAKRDNLIRCCPGAVVAYEPRFLWVNALNPLQDDAESAYNNILRDVLEEHFNYFYVDVNDIFVGDSNSFDHQMRLNGMGQVRFWLEVDKITERIDKKKSFPKRRQPQTTPDNRRERHTGNGKNNNTKK